jgi:hypothetical protein
VRAKQNVSADGFLGRPSGRDRHEIRIAIKSLQHFGPDVYKTIGWKRAVIRLPVPLDLLMDNVLPFRRFISQQDFEEGL